MKERKKHMVTSMKRGAGVYCMADPTKSIPIGTRIVTRWKDCTCVNCFKKMPATTARRYARKRFQLLREKIARQIRKHVREGKLYK
jgi:hypothetical protein